MPQGARRFQPISERAEQKHGRALVRWLWAYADCRLGDNAQPAFRPGDQLVKIRPRRRRGNGVRRPATPWGCHACASQKILRLAVPIRKLPGTAGRDPSAECGELERLREVTERVPAVLENGL